MLPRKGEDRGAMIGLSRRVPRVRAFSDFDGLHASFSHAFSYATYLTVHTRNDMAPPFGVAHTPIWLVYWAFAKTALDNSAVR